jgi:hypothetical protein
VDYGNGANGGVYVGSNTYINFGCMTTALGSFSASSPSCPTLFLGAADNSYQQVFGINTGTGYRLRYEGATGTSGVIGSPTIVLEVTFEMGGDLVVDVGQNAAAALQIGLSDGLGTWALTPANLGGTLAPYTSYRLSGLATAVPGGVVVVPPPPPSITSMPIAALAGSGGMPQLWAGGSVDDAVLAFTIPFSFYMFNVRRRCLSRAALACTRMRTRMRAAPPAPLPSVNPCPLPFSSLTSPSRLLPPHPAARAADGLWQRRQRRGLCRLQHLHHLWLRHRDSGRDDRRQPALPDAPPGRR